MTRRVHDDPPEPPADPPSSPRGVTRQDVFSVLGGLGAILTLFTAVMFYFGWQRSDVQARAMGIDVSLFGYTTQDYVLRSISSLYLPLLVLLGIGLGWLWLHGRVVALIAPGPLPPGPRRARMARWTSWVALAAAGIAVVSLLAAVSGGISTPPPPIAWVANELRPRQWVIPGVLVVATLVASYLWWIFRQLEPGPRRTGRPLWQTLLPIALVAGTVALGGFWMLEEYATVVGRGRAEQLSHSVGSLARAVVVSPTPLGIEAPGVVEEREGQPGTPEVRYRTSGLRLLARSGGKVLLVHDGWAPRTGTVIVLADRENLTWEFSR